MADYVVRFTGQDNLSGTINKINSELKEVGNNTPQLDQIMQKFNRIDQSAAPLKKKLRDLQNIMAQMNIKGLNNTDEFTIIAQKAGEIKDAISDASQAVSKYANDTFKLQAGIEAFQGLAAAGSLAAGVMGLVGTENKKVEQAILKVQSAMAILNGVQQIANLLNKDSALMLRLKTIWTTANTTSTTTNTVATTANTIATGANTTAMGVSTVAQNAWNVAKAVGKALLGDWTGLVLVGAAALGTYAIATSGATDEQDKQSKALDNTADSMDNYKNTMQSTFAQLMTSYAQLRAEWKNLSTEQQKNQWIKENQNKLADLNISVNNVADAEKAFADNTPNVVRAFLARAKAAAQLALLTENYKKQMELIDKINTAQSKAAAEAATRPRVQAGQKITDGSYHNSRYGSVNAAGEWVYSQSGATLYNTGISTSNPVINKMEGELKGLQADADKIANGIAETLKDVPTVTHHSGSTNRGNTTGSSNIPAPNGSLQAYEDQLAKLNKQLKLTPESDTATIERLKNQIAEITAKKDALAIQLGLKEPKKEETKKFAEGSIAAIKDEISKLDARLLNENLDLPTRLEIITKKDELQKQVDELSNVGKPVTVESKVKIQEGGFEKSFKEFADNAGVIINSIDNIDGVVSSFEQLTHSIQEGANAWEIFMGIVDSANSIISAIGSTMESVNTIMELLGATTAATSAVEAQAATQSVTNSGTVIAAKSGEAIAGATASGAKMPFPLNLVAIAAGIAAVIAAISMIGSFADGGIIKGSAFHGDTMLARVNAGEMILNPKQQNHLFNLLDGNTTNGGGVVEFKLVGKNLKGVLKNYDNIMSKVQ